MELRTLFTGRVVSDGPLGIDDAHVGEFGVAEPEGELGAAVLGHAACAETRDELGGDGFAVDAGAGDATLEEGEEFLLADADKAVGLEAVHELCVFGYDADAEDQADVKGGCCEALGASVGGYGILVCVA